MSSKSMFGSLAERFFLAEREQTRIAFDSHTNMLTRGLSGLGFLPLTNYLVFSFKSTFSTCKSTSMA
jgi:hypothetical protein